MRILPALWGHISAPAFALAAPLLLLSQNLIALATFRWFAVPVVMDWEFWLLPLRRLATLPDLPAWLAGLLFSYSLLVTWALAILAFRRAARSSSGYALAALAIVPAVQIAALAILALLPVQMAKEQEPDKPDKGAEAAHIIQGVLAGIAIIVLAVLISAVTFGSYGWGLFVMTPFMVGLATAYIANRSVPLEGGQTFGLVLIAAALGTLALIMFALEGLLCVLMAAPLGIIVALLGGWFGHALARLGHRRGRPLLSVALLPAVFALEGAIPPAVTIDVAQSVEIAAPPAAVWDAITSDAPIAPPPFLIAQSGFAFPLGGRLDGQGVGAERRGAFSTGIARERITQWVPGRTLSFTVVSQPAMMEEMSPYRRVHAPHLHGYFETRGTRFEITPLGKGRSRLTISASHVLRIDPALYWEPLARWAIRANVTNVLNSFKARAEAAQVASRPVSPPARKG